MKRPEGFKASISDNPELHLWRGVIAQAIIDATGWRRNVLSPDEPGIKKVTRKGRLNMIAIGRGVRDDARRWLLNDSDDFREVCHLAGLDPGAVQDRAFSLQEAGWPCAAGFNHVLAA